MLTVEVLKKSHKKKKHLIRKRLAEFRTAASSYNDNETFNELVFCILAAGTSAKMGIETVEKIKDVLPYGDVRELSQKLKGIYRFYNIRAEYIVHTRDYLLRACNMKLKEQLNSINHHMERRDFLALTRDIRGIGYKEASHFLRNMGYRGYSILDKHVIKCLHELNVIDSDKPPSGRSRYLEIEKKLTDFCCYHNFDPDELDLLLWSEKTGDILK